MAACYFCQKRPQPTLTNKLTSIDLRATSSALKASCPERARAAADEEKKSGGGGGSGNRLLAFPWKILAILDTLLPRQSLEEDAREAFLDNIDLDSLRVYLASKGYEEDRAMLPILLSRLRDPKLDPRSTGISRNAQ